MADKISKNHRQGLPRQSMLSVNLPHFTLAGNSKSLCSCRHSPSTSHLKLLKLADRSLFPFSSSGMYFNTPPNTQIDLASPRLGTTHTLSRKLHRFAMTWLGELWTRNEGDHQPAVRISASSNNYYEHTYPSCYYLGSSSVLLVVLL